MVSSSLPHHRSTPASAADLRRRVMVARLTACLLLALVGVATSAGAGTICGTVRDADTTAGIESAGVLVFDEDGMYTGHFGVTDASGDYCIDLIPPGTYDLHVHVDDYLAAILRDVVVTDDVVDADMNVPAPIVSLAPPAPNPARHAVRLRVSIRESRSVVLSVLDVNGRLVRGWRAERPSAGYVDLTWDLRDADGREAAPGRYWVRLETDDVVITRAFTLVR